MDSLHFTVSLFSHHFTIKESFERNLLKFDFSQFWRKKWNRLQVYKEIPFKCSIGKTSAGVYKRNPL